MNESTEIQDPFEMLQIGEYTKRLKVGRTTIFKWKQDGILIPGHHFIKRGKIVRYIWTRDLIMELHENETINAKDSTQQYIDIKSKKRKLKNKIAINLDY